MTNLTSAGRVGPADRTRGCGGMRTRWEPGFRCGHLAPFVAEHPGQMVRSFRAAMVIRSLRIVAVGALRMRRLSSRTALARR